eukprot:TRINITY_DN10445_c0_g2_i1.p1 TRINITY_DN10445_c0_g2~~TRINITY_DN10445_c0_g2_i1.p1  ORF type:complete len:275 (-),score=-33.99 TRINITY_DN10445_c0_g2_i1:465-1289(-)
MLIPIFPILSTISFTISKLIFRHFANTILSAHPQVNIPKNDMGAYIRKKNFLLAVGWMSGHLFGKIRHKLKLTFVHRATNKQFTPQTPILTQICLFQNIHTWQIPLQSYPPIKPALIRSLQMQQYAYIIGLHSHYFRLKFAVTIVFNKQPQKKSTISLQFKMAKIFYFQQIQSQTMPITITIEQCANTDTDTSLNRLRAPQNTSLMSPYIYQNIGKFKGFLFSNLSHFELCLNVLVRQKTVLVYLHRQYPHSSNIKNKINTHTKQLIQKTWNIK